MVASEQEIAESGNRTASEEALPDGTFWDDGTVLYPDCPVQ